MVPLAIIWDAPPPIDDGPPPTKIGPPPPPPEAPNGCDCHCCCRACCCVPYAMGEAMPTELVDMGDVIGLFAVTVYPIPPPTTELEEDEPKALL